MRLDEYAAHDALGLAALVRAGDVTPGELVALAVEAAGQLNPMLNAVVATYPDRIESAGAARFGAFAGVPTMVKDLFHGEVGWECGNGSRLCAGWRVAHADEFTARLHGAGLVPMARTTTSEFGLLGTTETLAAGRTCSPWDASVMAGGSSGGAAAVVGAGIVPIAGASDGGGSIRIPASACGVVGLKPSRGRITWGPLVGEPLLGWAVHFVTTRTVRDAAAALDALSGPLPGDPFEIASPPRPFLDEVGAPTLPLRIGFWAQPWSGQAADPEVVAAAEAVAGVLAELGHRVEPARPTFSWESFLSAMSDVWSSTTAHTIDDMAAVLGREPGTETLEGASLELLRHGRAVTARELIDAAGTVNGIARSVGTFFTEYDLLLTPTLGALPAPLGRYDPRAPLPPREMFAEWSRHESFLPVFNATGNPAISLPLTMSPEGLPIGMQLVGRFGAEGLLLRVASALEQAMPWAGRTPPIHASRVTNRVAPVG
jgi:amidase